MCYYQFFTHTRHPCVENSAFRTNQQAPAAEVRSWLAALRYSDVEHNDQQLLCFLHCFLVLLFMLSRIGYSVNNKDSSTDTPWETRASFHVQRQAARMRELASLPASVHFHSHTLRLVHLLDLVASEQLPRIQAGWTVRNF